MSALERMLVRFVCKEGDSSGLFNCHALITFQKSRWSPKSRKRYRLCQPNVPIPIGHLAKIKTLELGAISWQ